MEQVRDLSGEAGCGSLRADSLRIEATFLPDHAGKELDWKGVLRRRLF